MRGRKPIQREMDWIDPSAKTLALEQDRAACCLRRGCRNVNRRQRCFEFGHFGALVVQLGLMREGVAEARLEAGQPTRRLGDSTSFLGEFDFKPAERQFKARNQAKRGHVPFAGNRVGWAGANEFQLKLVEKCWSSPRSQSRRSRRRLEVDPGLLRLQLASERRSAPRPPPCVR